MKNSKELFVVSLVAVAVMASSFIFTIFNSIISGTMVDPSYFGVVFFLIPAIIGLVLLAISGKAEDKIKAYIGQLVFAVSAVFLFITLIRDALSSTSVLIYICFCLWPLILYVVSLNLVTFSRKKDYVNLHKIMTIVLVAGLGLAFASDIVFTVIWANILDSISSMLMLLGLAGGGAAAVVASFGKDTAQTK